MWCINWIEEGKSQLIKGVVGGAADRRNLTGKGPWSGQRIKEGAWEKNDGRICIRRSDGGRTNGGEFIIRKIADGSKTAQEDRVE